jgi:AcrR family transcriptional regulator
VENRVRDQIVNAAFEVLTEVGPARLRIQEVARRAEVSPTLLYYYFDGKHALIAAAYARDYASILDEDLTLVRDAFANSENPFDLMQQMTVNYRHAFEDVETRRRRLDALAAAQHDSVVAAAIAPKQAAFIEELRLTMTGMVARGWLPEGVNLDGFILAMVSLPLGLVFTDLDRSFNVDLTSYLTMLAAGAVATAVAPSSS